MDRPAGYVIRVAGPVDAVEAGILAGLRVTLVPDGATTEPAGGRPGATASPTPCLPVAASVLSLEHSAAPRRPSVARDARGAP